jgi:hypothetical protein
MQNLEMPVQMQRLVHCNLLTDIGQLIIWFFSLLIHMVVAFSRAEGHFLSLQEPWKP